VIGRFGSDVVETDVSQRVKAGSHQGYDTKQDVTVFDNQYFFWPNFRICQQHLSRFEIDGTLTGSHWVPKLYMCNNTRLMHFTIHQVYCHE
jgi:hypothetical protein